MSSSTELIVSTMIGSQTVRVGTLWFHYGANKKEAASFEYEKQWLAHPEKYAIDPYLPLAPGSYHTKMGVPLFGAIGDAAPDRWGRMLMRRAAAFKLVEQRSQVATLSEIDYLIGVSDFIRQGALRFSLPSDERCFLTPSTDFAVPPLITLPKLLHASQKIIDDCETEADVKLLLAPGSSLGGARPKAVIKDADGMLSIAKFPKSDDDFDILAWEAVALHMAHQAGINVSPWRLVKILKKHVLLIKRFDRINDQRIPFVSAMSMLDARDHEKHSYLEFIDLFVQYGSQPVGDMHELWRRIVFTIMISNTDDHLRNHGFLYERSKGRRLSPAYDMNPTPLEVKPHLLTLAIDFHDTDASLETALSIASVFRLSKDDAHEIVRQVKGVVSQWQTVAAQYGISKKERDRMASAFRV